MTELTVAVAEKAGYEIAARKTKGQAGKGLVWVRLADGTADKAKAKVPEEIAASKFGYAPRSSGVPSPQGTRTRLTTKAVADFIDKSDEERLASIFKEIGFVQRDNIMKLLPTISEVIKKEQIKKIDSEIKALEQRKKALTGK